VKLKPTKRGRPVLPPELATKPHAVRLTDSRWEKLKRLGSGWLNRAIDRAKEKEQQ